METLGLVIAIGAVGATFFYSIWPIMRPEAASGALPDEQSAQALSSRELTRMLLDRDRAYKNIMDIEFDKEMGKLSDKDYARMMGPARGRATEVLRRLDARGVKEGMAPLRLSEREAEQAAFRLKERRPLSEEKGLAESSLNERLEAEILRYRKRATGPGDYSVSGTDEKKTRVCASCAHVVDGADNFCAACGRPLN